MIGQGTEHWEVPTSVERGEQRWGLVTSPPKQQQQTESTPTPIASVGTGTRVSLSPINDVMPLGDPSFL